MTGDEYDSGIYTMWIGEDIMTLPNIGHRTRYFIFRSGKIVMVWNAWWSRYMFWTAPALVIKVKKAMFIWFRWFAGTHDHNRGRHWDRKVA